eukprot:6007067-Karenia_brevis.AAC.1
MPLTTLLYIHWAFLDRYRNQTQEATSTWRHIVMILGAKIQKPKSFENFRGISLIDVLAKWYMACLIELAKVDLQKVPKHWWDEVLIFGYLE